MCQSTMAILQHCPHTVMRFTILEFPQTSLLRRRILKQIIKRVILIEQCIINFTSYMEVISFF